MRQIFALLILSFLILSYSSSPDNDSIIGTYYKSWGYSSTSIEFKNDGEYYQIISSCTYDLFFAGTWELKSDTVRLCKREMGNSKSKDMYPLYNEEPDFYILQGDQLIYLNSTDTETFPSEQILNKVTPVKINNIPTKRKVRKK